MEQTGYVTKVNKDRVFVRVDRESSCGGNCVSCKGCPTSAVIVECAMRGDLKIGDTVRLVMPAKSFFINVFWGYGLMTILAIFGSISAYLIFLTEAASVLGLIAGIAGGLLISRFVFKNKNGDIIAVLYEK